MSIKRFFTATLMLAGFVVNAEDGGDKAVSGKDKGYLTGSFETNTSYYLDDSKVNIFAPDDHFGSNNYLKLDYYKGRFSAGAQVEGYLPVLQNYPVELKNANLTNLYVSWKDENFDVTAGSFYEQYGSGLLFRSWEDRALGLNNSLFGAKFGYSYKDIFAIRAMVGTPRFGMEYKTNTYLRGADASLAVSNFFNSPDWMLSLEGSVLRRYEALSQDLRDEGAKENTVGYSARLNFDFAGFFAKLEHVNSGQKYYAAGLDSDRNYDLKKGNAQLVEVGYNNNGLGVTLTGRRLEWMNTHIVGSSNSIVNMTNYVPAMSTQYTYLLTTLNPYSPVFDGSNGKSGEIGGQFDIFYNFRRGTALGGKRGMKVHANFSTYYTLDREASFRAGNMLFRDFSFDVEKLWTKKFKSVLLYSLQDYNGKFGNYGEKKKFIRSHIVVADLLYKWTDQLSTRLELQYLVDEGSCYSSKRDEGYAVVDKQGYELTTDKGDWMAALLEVSFAPHWSVFGSDMVNHGKTGRHYYNVGVSYARSRTRVALGYGRFKDGYICSGGVCRAISAYTGANIHITTSF